MSEARIPLWIRLLACPTRKSLWEPVDVPVAQGAALKIQARYRFKRQLQLPSPPLEYDRRWAGRWATLSALAACVFLFTLWRALVAATDAQGSVFAQLSFSHCTNTAFDQNGLLYAIGTDFGRAPYRNPSDAGKVRVTWSPDAANFYSTNGGHKQGDATQAARVITSQAHPGARATMWSRGAPGAWFAIDLVDVMLRPTHFAYRNDYGGGGNHPRVFELQGSNDGTSWQTLSRHNGQAWSGEQAKDWPVIGVEEFYRIFRILNQGAPNHLCCSGLELYGDVKAASAGHQQIPQPPPQTVPSSGTGGPRPVVHAKPGGRFTWQRSREYAEAHGGRLLTLEEARAHMSGQAIYPGEDQWCAVQGRDWVQVGDRPHHPGTSHRIDFQHYPPWGDFANDQTYGNPSWNHVVLYRVEGGGAKVAGMMHQATKGALSGGGASLEEVARAPASFALVLSGHHDHPDCNGRYAYDGEENGKPKWAKEGGGGTPKLFWTGHSWDVFWGGYSPESSSNTPVPPLDGYLRDKGGCDIRVSYERADTGSGGAQLPGHYFSFATGGNPNEVVDRFEARVEGNRVTYYRGGTPHESYEIRGNQLHGPVRATIQPNGDIEYSHGYTSRKEGGGDGGKSGGLRLGSTPSHGNPPSTSALNTELNNVARNTDDTARARALVAAGAQLDSTNGPYWRHTPLHQAAYFGRYEMAACLVELGAPLQLPSNPCGRGATGTPLELARGGGHERVAELIERAIKGGGHEAKGASGAEVLPAPRAALPAGFRFQDGFGEATRGDQIGHITSGGIESHCFKGDKMKWPLHWAAMIGDLKAIDALLAAGHDPNVKMTDWFDSEPLGWAASFGQSKAIEALCAAGADPSRPANLAGNTPLSDAQREGHKKAIELIKEYLSGARSIGKKHSAVSPAVVVGTIVAGSSAASKGASSSSSDGKRLLFETVDVLRRELNLKGTIAQVVKQACAQLGVDTVGKSLTQQADECWEIVYRAHRRARRPRRRTRRRRRHPKI